VLSVLFAGSVATAELRGVADQASLFHDELEVVAKVDPRRKRDFTAGRLCARRAMQLLGVPSVPLLVTPQRMPLWPDGVVGCISHTDGFCGAVAAHSQQFLSLGLDCERTLAVTRDLWRAITTQQELIQLLSMPPERAAIHATIAFVAKEAFFKCQYPLTAQWLDFADVSVQLEEITQTIFHFVIEPSKSLRIFSLLQQSPSGWVHQLDRHVFGGMAMSIDAPRGTEGWSGSQCVR
jgi:4'-phosphopantetheinyl transferase EntD